MTLKYLFQAVFEDQTIIEQSPADVSCQDPRKSAFWDVISKTDSPLVHFQIWDAHGNCFSVNLQDGHFEANNLPMQLSPVATDTIPPGGRYELIYFRDHKHQLQVGGDGQSQTHEVKYRIGWHYHAPDGKTYTQCMVVS